MFQIRFLAQKTPEEVKQAIAGFSQRYVLDWKQWTRSYEYQASHIPSSVTVSEFGRILRKWQATRPNPMRRPQSEATHAAPYLEDLLTEAWPHLKVIEGLSVRNMEEASQAQHDALLELWDIFRKLASRGSATCVGVTKAVLLLTQGRIGPALDSMVRRELYIRQPPAEGTVWVDILQSIGQDISIFETKYGVCIEDLAPVEWSITSPGRAYDMIAGPR